MKNLFVSIVASIAIGIAGFVFFWFELGYKLMDAAISHVAAVVRGGRR